MQRKASYRRQSVCGKVECNFRVMNRPVCCVRMPFGNNVNEWRLLPRNGVNFTVDEHYYYRRLMCIFRPGWSPLCGVVIRWFSDILGWRQYRNSPPTHPPTHFALMKAMTLSTFPFVNWTRNDDRRNNLFKSPFKKCEFIPRCYFI